MKYKYKCQEYLAIRKEKIILIPEDCVIDQKRLCGLSNDEFVSTFKMLQETISVIYDNAIKDPEAWGYPLESYVIQQENWGGARGVRYERIPDVLAALFTEGKIIDKTLYVDIGVFKNKVKKHKHYTLVLRKLTEFGFEISGFEKGAKEYVISFPDDDNAIIVMHSYIQAAAEVYSIWKPAYQGMMREAFVGCLFFRFIEEKQKQKYDMIFHVMTDTFTEEYRSMCMMLYDKAVQTGHLYFPYYKDICGTVFSAFQIIVTGFSVKYVTAN